MLRRVRLAAIVLPLWTIGCVGPATPFGSLDQATPSEKLPELNNSKSVYLQGVRIRFKPERMVLHKASDFEIEVWDPAVIQSPENIRIIYDNDDVTESFLSNGELIYSQDRKRVTMRFPRLRFPSDKHNRVYVAYHRNDKDPYIVHYKQPLCPVKRSRTIASLPAFNAPTKLISHIDTTARKAGINPTLMAGIVAQESAFDPKAISWAKALGLTQITPIAEQELLPLVQDWPRHPNINSMSYAEIRTKILTGSITKKTEWRLDPEKSILGGVAYLDYLVKYWSNYENRAIIEKLGGEFDQNFSEVILASYNSGASRVRSAINGKGNRWREASNLGEANRYVNRVSSYCYHFSSNKEF